MKEAALRAFKQQPKRPPNVILKPVAQVRLWPTPNSTYRKFKANVVYIARSSTFRAS